MLQPNDLFITDYTALVDDLYRNGNSTHPRFDNLRPDHDAHIYEKNGIKWIRADGNGISAFTTYDPFKKNWWKIPKGAPIPPTLRLVKDLRPGFQNHFMIAPAFDMSLAEYIMQLNQLRERCEKIS